MFKTRVAILGVLALFIASGIATSTASAAGPFWHVNGSKLATTKQVKLQSKGTSVLVGKGFGIATVEIECKNSVSEGATIENGATQGQDKGRITFTQCTTITPTEEACRINSPITTNPTKSFLATNPNSKQQKYVDVFEPTEGKVFVTLKFLKNCQLFFKEANVEGAVAAEILPIEKEGQEGLLNFPKEPISTVIHEQQELKIGLLFAGEPTKFGATYGARLETNEKWGVFGQ